MLSSLIVVKDILFAADAAAFAKLVGESRVVSAEAAGVLQGAACASAGAVR